MTQTPASAAAGILTGQAALITGAASGIGRATALVFAREGANLCLVDQNSAAAEQTAAAVRAFGVQAVVACGDVASAAFAEQAVQAAVSGLSRLDILFNNAGITRRRSVVETTIDEWDRVVAVNLRSVFLFSRFAIPAMLANGGGAIVNTGSGWGLVGGRQAASYCATKGAVVNLTRAMALDHAPAIRVNCICPGDTATAMLSAEQTQLGQESAAFLADAARRPLGRVGQPEEIAEGVLYLASSRSAFVTGTTLVVDGGGLAGS
jgi:NAD(P)-dependent dehydrogenase (short-subunit alcohol dehydrogenase family)